MIINKIKNIDTKSLKFKLWVSFILFTSFILLFLWMFQYFFFPSYYEIAKQKEIKYVSGVVYKNIYNQNIQNIIDELAYKYSTNIYIVNNNSFNNIIYSSDISTLKPQNHNKLNINLNHLNNGQITRIISDRFNINMFAIYTKIDNNYSALVTTPVEVIDTSVRILRNQLTYISLGLILVGAIISFFISKYLSKPIKDIEKEAKKLGTGNYNIKFDSDEYTEIKNLSDTLNYATKELEKTDNLRVELLANVSHDLKTPLTMIKSYAELLKDLPQKEEQKEEKLNIIIEETDRLNILVNDIMNLSKLESNIDKLNIENTNLSELINNIIKNFTYLKEKENYIFITNIKDNCYSNIDKSKISQVIYNLVGNAINYTGKDKNIIINLYEKDNFYRLEIIDSGKGISDKETNKIWDKYYTVKLNHKRNVISTGLGLNIVKNVLKKHNLDFGVISKINKGSTFYINFKK